MTQWGTGGWGTGTWGSGSQEGDPPFLGAISPAIADTRGGTVISVFGSNFVDPMSVEIIDPIGGEVLGTAYYFEAQLDLRNSKLLVGFPALPAGTYGVRITTPAGTSAVLPDAITYKLFAEEAKVHRVRRAWAPVWATGERLLS